MKPVFLALVTQALVVCLAGSGLADEKVYPMRWFYVSRGLHKDSDVADIRRLVKTAAEHGLNGMLLSAGLDRLSVQPEHYFRRLEAVKQVCAEHKVEIIPSIFSVGYGGSVMRHNRNLAAGLAVENAPFVVRDGQAQLKSDLPSGIVNGGLEEHEGKRVAGFAFHDLPGTISLVDTDVVHQGKASLRFENFSANKSGHGRLMQKISVRPHRCYRITCWVKTEGLEPTGCFRIQAHAGDRSLTSQTPRLESTNDWQRVSLGFNSLAHEQLRIYLGVWKAERGRFWVDDIRIEEVGLANVLRRPGTPVSVRDAQTGTLYEEQRDFAPIVDRRLNFRLDHAGPTIKLLPGSRIKEGQELRVSYYHGMSLNKGQVTVCMSEPEMYDNWRTEAALLHRHLSPRMYLLAMDEIREGGACQACKRRKMNMGRILGDCITRQFNILRAVNPKAEVAIWSDMLDPAQNAHDNYYLVDGDFTGAWNHVPKDLIIVCWHHKIRDRSLRHFSGLGFRTLAGAYYDADTLDNPKDWLKSLDQTPNAVGVMYTSWRNKYDLLGPFGDLVTER